MASSSKSKSIELSKISKEGPALAGLSRSDAPIAALTSGAGGAVSIIRVSGALTFNVLNQFLEQETLYPREMVLAKFLDPETQEVLDELMLCCFVGPRSFTGEDTAELFCHGGPYIVQRILKTLFQHGCRPADPGEFTKRAFLNGKMDLTAAEGVRELVEASTHQQWKAARQLATGRLGNYIKDLRQEIIGAMAFLEARIDFPDEGDTQGVALDHVKQRVEKVDAQLERLAESFDSGRVASSGLMLAIIGAPNMGKSSLMNSLLDRERAIVTDIAGTTRDYIEERCMVNGRLIRLIDTAGIRETNETVEKIGVQSSIEFSEKADLVLTLVSVNASDAEQDYFKKVASSIDPSKLITVVNKIDLAPAKIEENNAHFISCTTGEGLDGLKQEIADRVDGYLGRLKDEPFITSARHMTAVEESKSFISKFFMGLEDGLYEEMLAFELQNAVRSLSSIIGDVEHDDLLDRIFSEFCVGK